MTQEMILSSISTWEKFKAKDKLSGEEVRVVKEPDGNIFVFAKGRKSRGYRYLEKYFLEKYEVKFVSPEKKNAAWHKKIDKLMKKLTESGLWPELLIKLENLSQMTLSDQEEIKTLYDKRYTRGSIETLEEAYKRNTEEIKALYGSKYPFIIAEDSSGEIYVDTWYLWEMSACKTKSMYFGKYYNKEYKARIKNALLHNEKLSLSTQAGYDVSFSYDPELKKAYYSEEYRGCGNGHYYLAVDENTAWFCEND